MSSAVQRLPCSSIVLQESSALHYLCASVQDREPSTISPLLLLSFFPGRYSFRVNTKIKALYA